MVIVDVETSEINVGGKEWVDVVKCGGLGFY